MTRDLGSELVIALAGVDQGLTARELAKRIGARHIDVIRCLTADLRFESFTSSRRPSGAGGRGSSQHTRTVYRIRQEGRERLGAANTESHTDRVLAILRDGRWHTSTELYQATNTMVHSRVSELRDRGYTIDHDGGGPGAKYHSYRWDPDCPKRATKKKAA